MSQQIFNFDEAATQLGLGRNTLFKKLRELNILNKENIPYRCYVDGGYFKTQQSYWVHPKTKEQRLAIKPLITLRGMGWVDEQLSEQKINGEKENDGTTRPVSAHN